MWRTHSTAIPGGQRVTFERDGTPATWDAFIAGLQGEEAMRTVLTDVLAGLPYTAVKWETPPVTRSTLGQPVECVVLDAPSLARRPDPLAFAEHFGPSQVVTFDNLGRDAIMVVPCPRAPDEAYGHLLAFLRRAPETQSDALWRAVGSAMQRRIGRKPVWLSTAGGGVSWLHVRLDDRPKYYGHAPYRATAIP